jgi:uncharacterized protein YbjT (DUF2867 family)
MKIVIPGGNGQVGTILARAFQGDGHEVVVLSRRPHQQPWRVVTWDGVTLGDWLDDIDGCDAVARALDASDRARDFARPPAAARVVAGEHRHDLFAPI